MRIEPRIGGAEMPGNVSTDEPAESDGQPSELRRVQAFTLGKTPENHGGLNGAKEEQRSGAGRQAEIGEGESGGVNEKRSGGRPIACASPGLPPEQQNQAQYRRAREQPDEGETGGVNRGLFERQPTEERVPGKGDHGRQREQDEAGRFHLWKTKTPRQNAGR